MAGPSAGSSVGSLRFLHCAGGVGMAMLTSSGLTMSRTGGSKSNVSRLSCVGWRHRISQGVKTQAMVTLRAPRRKWSQTQAVHSQRVPHYHHRGGDMPARIGRAHLSVIHWLAGLFPSECAERDGNGGRDPSYLSQPVWRTATVKEDPVRRPEPLGEVWRDGLRQPQRIYNHGIQWLTRPPSCRRAQ